MDSKLLLLPAFKTTAAVIRQYHGLELHGYCGWKWLPWVSSLSFLGAWCHCCSCGWVQPPCSCMSAGFPTSQDLVLRSEHSWYSKGRVVVCAWNSPLQILARKMRHLLWCEYIKMSGDGHHAHLMPHSKYFASKLQKIMEENYSLYFHYEIFILWFAVWGRFLFCKTQFVLVFTFFSLMVNCEEAEEKGYWLPSNVKINIRTLFEMLFSSHFAVQFVLKRTEIQLFQAKPFLFLSLNIKIAFKRMS